MKRYIVLFVALWFTACKSDNSNYQKEAANPEFLIRSEVMLTESIIHDIFAPPVSARIYMYASIAGYEAAVHGNKDYKSLVGQLNGFEKVAQPKAGEEYCFPLASVRAYLAVGKKLTFAQELYDEFDKKLEADYKKIGIADDVYDRSIAFGDSVAESIMKYASKDNYKQTRGFRFTVTNLPGTWTPTPPAYIDAVEPYWTKIRPAVLDSSAQFRAPEPSKFDLAKGSPYYKEVMQAYETVKNLTNEQRDIANFWDCNPFKMNITGHAMFATKKMSPGGHWLGIAGQVSRQLNKNYIQTAEAFALTSIAIFDGFISCWDEKYRSIRIRPETVINASIDKTWMPVLQTPPFPEYTSGHSTISRSAAVVLTKLFGENVAFNDSTEIPYGLPPRKFTSFIQASDEASISRLYGGIHFWPALDEGAKQGQKVGSWLIQTVKTHE
ncbi:vanadium-dependent haloperoxidase [Aquirufa ecclesiirivi]